MLKKWMSITMIGSIWALIIYIYSLFTIFIFNYFNYSFLIISVGPVIGIIFGLKKDEKVGSMICLISGITFLIIILVISQGYIIIFWLFVPTGVNLTPLIFVFIGGIIGYKESRMVNKDVGTKTEEAKVLKTGLCLSLIGGILSFLWLPLSYSIYDFSSDFFISQSIITWGSIIGVLVGLLYKEKIGSIICICSIILYLIYRLYLIPILGWWFFFLGFIEFYSYNFTPLMLVLLGGIIGYFESPKREDASKLSKEEN